MKLSKLIVPGIILGLPLIAAALTRWSTLAAERHQPPTGRFLEIDAVRLHYVDLGTGPPIVLLHGNGVTLQDWEASGILEILAEQHRVIAFDRPGFGYSSRPRGGPWTPHAQAEIIHEALRQLQVPNAVVVGHSWGTLVALALAFAHPMTIRSLFLLSGYYFPTIRLDVPVSSAPAIPFIGDLLRYTASPLLGLLTAPMLLKQLFAPAPVPDSFRRSIFPMALRPSQLRANAQDTALMIPSAMEFSEKYKTLTMPVAVITGDRDKVVSPQAHSERLARTITRGTLDVIIGAGHMVHYTATKAVADAITTAANETSPVRSST